MRLVIFLHSKNISGIPPIVIYSLGYAIPKLLKSSRKETKQDLKHWIRHSGSLKPIINSLNLRVKLAEFYGILPVNNASYTFFPKTNLIAQLLTGLSRWDRWTLWCIHQPEYDAFGLVENSQILTPVEKKAYSTIKRLPRLPYEMYASVLSETIQTMLPGYYLIDTQT